MTSRTNGSHLEVGGVPVEVVRKDIKNLHIGVYPPSGRIRVAAPLHLDDDAVRLAVISRLGWLRRQQTAFEQQVRQSQREFVTGESHYFEGRRYRLDVLECHCRAMVRLQNNKTLVLRVRPETDREGREALLYRWYRGSAPYPYTPAYREMGTQDRRACRRGSHPEDEDTLGVMQQFRPTHLAESGTGKETTSLSGIRIGARNGASGRAQTQ